MDLRLDPDLGRGFRSQAQVTKVVTESWVRDNIRCLSCGKGGLQQTPANTPARDFVCDREGCREPFELKARRRPLGAVVTDGAFETLSRTIAAGNAPNLLLLECDRERSIVRQLVAIHRSLLTASALFRRPPLAPTAKRAGWVGANILLDRLPMGALVPIVSLGTPIDPGLVRRDWERFEFVRHLPVEDRGWLADLLVVLRRVSGPTFTVRDVYRFETELAALHPSNRNVRPKIRQQLQILVRQGEIGRVSRGLYVLASAGHPEAR